MGSIGSASELFAGIDAGTTGVTVAVFDVAGNEVGKGYQEYPCLYPHPGWVEQDMETVWQGICKASRQALAGIPQGERNRIRSIGFSSQRGTFVLLDKAEQPLGAAVVWNDSRAKEMEDELVSRIGQQEFHATTGMPLSASWAIAKIAWLYKARPDTMEKARRICNGQEYFLRRLGADSYETDPSSLTLNGMMDIRKLDWSVDLCRKAGIEPSLLPPVTHPGKQVGSVSKAASLETGFVEGTALCIGGGDQQCAAVGAGVIEHGFAEITVGTSAMMVAHLDSPDLLKGKSAYMGGHAIAGKWDLEGGAFAIGSCLRWWRDQFGQAEVPSAQALKVSPYELMMAQANAAPAGSHGVLFHPFLAGQVTPYYDAMARGGFFGLGLNHTRHDLIRAVLEGCAFEMRMMLDALHTDLDGGITDLRLTGGGTKSPVFTQIMADILDRTVHLPRNPECTVLGAAILGAVGSGFFKDVHEGVRAMVHVARSVLPNAGNRRIYDDLYGVYRRLYEQLAQGGVYQDIYRIQAEYF